MGNISDYIEQFVLDKLKAFNDGKNPEKGIYYILLPNSKSLYYSLWFYNSKAIYHPYIFLTNLDMDAINSVDKAIKIMANSFYSLNFINRSDSFNSNGDDIIMFGKYRGHHLYEIYTIDPNYIHWITNKYEARKKSEQRFKDMAISYNMVQLDLHTSRKYKTPLSQHIGSIGEKLTNLKITITHVRLQDDPYKTKIEKGTISYYVDQKITAVDNSGNLFSFIIKAANRSLESGALNSASHIFNVGEKIEISSAKVLQHFIWRNIKYTRLGYIKF